MDEHTVRGGDICRKLCLAADELEYGWLEGQSRRDKLELLALNGGQLRLLRTVLRLTLNGDGGGVKLKQLAAAMRLSPSAASTAVETLVQTGYLCRTESQTDRRCVKITLADRGRKHLENVSGYFAMLVAGFTRRKSPEFCRVFEKALDDFLLFMQQRREKDE